MKKLLFSVLAMLCFVGMALAQDNIVLHTGDEIKAKVEEVGLTEIKYRRTDNPGGPLYTIRKSDVLLINYQNGTKDVFKSYEGHKAQLSPAKLPYGGDYNKLRKAGVKRIVAGSVLTGLGVPVFFTGVGLAASATTYDPNYPYGNRTNDSQQAIGGILIAAAIAMEIVGPITLRKGIKYRRLSKEVKPTIGFVPINSGLDKYSRAMGGQTVGAITLTF